MLSKQSWKRLVVNTVLAGALLLPTTSAFAEMISVKSGDTLWEIADRYNLTVEHLMIANHLKSDYVNIGDSLYIPPQSSIYLVQSGNTLWEIAERFGVTVQAITDASQLVSESLFVGQKLLIPDWTNDDDTADKPWVEMTNYYIRSGDTAWTVSVKFGIPMAEFLEVNKLTMDSMLSLGQKVNIPVHHIPVTDTPGWRYGEYLDWFTAAQYLYPINVVATVTDFQTGTKFKVKRTIGAFHADCEPLTATDTEVAKRVWGGTFSWTVRPVVVEYNNRRIAASMSFMPHGVEYVKGNNFNGHFDIHFLNSLRHKDNLIDNTHQAAIKIVAGR